MIAIIAISHLQFKLKFWSPLKVPTRRPASTCPPPRSNYTPSNDGLEGNSGWVPRQRTASALLGPGQSSGGYPSGKTLDKICKFCLEITSRCSFLSLKV